MSAMSANSCRGVGGRRGDLTWKMRTLLGIGVYGYREGFKRTAGKRRVGFFLVRPYLPFMGNTPTVPPLLVALDSSKIGKISHDRRNVSVLARANVPSFGTREIQYVYIFYFILFYERDVKPALLHLHHEM